MLFHSLSDDIDGANIRACTRVQRISVDSNSIFGCTLAPLSRLMSVEHSAKDLCFLNSGLSTAPVSRIPLCKKEKVGPSRKRSFCSHLQSYDRNLTYMQDIRARLTSDDFSKVIGMSCPVILRLRVSETQSFFGHLRSNFSHAKSLQVIR